MGAWDYIKKGASYTPAGRAFGIGAGLAQGDYKGAANAATFGLAGPAIDKAAGWYNEPYDQAKAANEQAGKDSERIGATALDMAGAGINRALDQTTPAARQWSRQYELGGELAGPGALEKRYQDRASGANPALDYDRKVGQEAIDNAFAARGLGNSGAALKATADLNANISAENQRQLDSLAAGAQGAQETRLGGAFDRLSNLGQGRANIVQNGTQGGIDSYTAGQLGGVNARLAAANTGLQKRKDTTGLLSQGVGFVTGLAGA
jgi:hypothetical protein